MKTQGSRKKITVYTDGACSGNPGPGGWAAILEYRGTEKEISGGAPETTNNRMEITAVVEALSILKEPCEVELHTDSQYVCNSMNNGWAESWKAKGWKRKGGEPALNADLWDKVLDLCAVHDVTFIWVKGHDGDDRNERCDRLAVSQSVAFQNNQTDRAKL